MKNTLFVLLALAAATAQECRAQTFLPDFGNLGQSLDEVQMKSDLLAYQADMDAAFRALYSKHDLEKAESRYASAVERANKLRSMAHWCEAMSGLASLALQQKDYAKAEGLYLRYLYYGKDVFGKAKLASGYTGLAEARSGLGRLDSAAGYFQKAMTLAEEDKEDSLASFYRAEAVEGLATVYAKQWKYKLAEASLREAIAGYGKNALAADATDKLVAMLLIEGRSAEASTLQAGATALRASVKDRDARAKEDMRKAHPELF